MTTDIHEPMAELATRNGRDARRWAAALVGVSVLALGVAAWRMRLPSPDGPLALPPETRSWGSTGPEGRSADQIVAAAADRGLAWAWSQPGVLQAAVSFPTAMRQDKGQTVLDRGFWTEGRPPVMATWLQQEQGATVWLRLDRAVVFNPMRVNLRWRGGRGVHDVFVPARPTPDGDCLAQWAPPADTPGDTISLLVKPEGWHEGFPIVLRQTVGPAGTTAVPTTPTRHGRSARTLAPWVSVSNSVRSLGTMPATPPMVVLTGFPEPLNDAEVIGPGFSYGLRSVVVAQRLRPGERALWWPLQDQAVLQSRITDGVPDMTLWEGVRPYRSGESPLPRR